MPITMSSSPLSYRAPAASPTGLRSSLVPGEGSSSFKNGASPAPASQRELSGGMRTHRPSYTAEATYCGGPSSSFPGRRPGARSGDPETVFRYKQDVAGNAKPVFTPELTPTVTPRTAHRLKSKRMSRLSKEEQMDARIDAEREVKQAILE